MILSEPFSDSSVNPPIRGTFHKPQGTPRGGFVLTHGAGANCNTALLMAMAEALANDGLLVLRCDLPFRQLRPNGPPGPGDAKRDRAGLLNALLAVREKRPEKSPLFLGGHSYGGRQSSMLAAEQPEVVDGLLLLSYPLHPPRKPEQLRTQHFTDLRTRALFVHGTRDPFGSTEELREAMKLISAGTELMEVEGAGHDLGFKGKATPNLVVQEIVAAFEGILA